MAYEEELSPRPPLWIFTCENCQATTQYGTWNLTKSDAECLILLRCWLGIATEKDPVTHWYCPACARVLLDKDLDAAKLIEVPKKIRKPRRPFYQ